MCTNCKTKFEHRPGHRLTRWLAWDFVVWLTHDRILNESGNVKKKNETFIQIDIRNFFWTLYHLNHFSQLATDSQHDVDTTNHTLADGVIHFTILNSSSFKNQTKSTFDLEFLSLSSRREKLSIKFYQDDNNKDDSNIFRKMMCCLFYKLIASFRV